MSRPVRAGRDSSLRVLRLFSSRMTLAIRVAVLTTAAVAATLTLVSATIYVTVRSEFQSSLDDSMIRRAQAGVTADLGSLFAGGADPGALALTDIKVIVLRSGRGVLLGTPAVSNFPVQFIGLPEREVSLGQHSQSVRTATLDGTPYRVVAVHSGPGEALVIAQSMESIDKALHRLQIILLLTSVIGVALAGLAGWAVAANGLRPVRRLTAATERVARTTDLTPITVTGTDELARLTISFNAMLTALDASQTRERQLIADAGHELRTPLTSLRTNIELMGQATGKGRRSLSEDESAEIMGDVRAQLEELTTLVGDLVELARDEPVRRDPEPLDLADVVSLAVSRVRLRASGVEFVTHTEPWMVVGEAQLLERAVTNLLDNAAKWSPDGGTVRVSLVEGVVQVSDEGPGIEPEDLPHIFDRFYRSTEARTLPGSGLGLSIVKRAADRHGGTAEVSSTLGEGATFTLFIPVAADA
jgi:two-component system sensor histidine kinase MprB